MTKKLLGLLALLLVVSACGSADDLTPNGEACEVDADCEADVCLLDLGVTVFPDGICAPECNIDDGTGCVDGEMCLLHQMTGASNCYPTCGNSDDCRDGYACFDFFTSALRACLPD